MKNISDNIIALEELGLVAFCIEKVGSTSIKTALLMALGLLKPEDRRPVHANPKFNFVFKEDIVTNPDLDKLYKFAIVRNPFGRLVSIYTRHISSSVPTGKLEQLGFTQGMSFRDFLNKIADIPRDQLSGDVPITRLFRPQSDYLVYKDELLPNYIGKFETIDKAWLEITNNCGNGKLPSTLPVENKSPFKPYPGIYHSDDLVEIVTEIYEEDFERFDYSKDSYSDY